MSVLGQEPSQGRAWDREVPAVRPRDWLSGQIRPGLGVAGLGLDVRNKTGTLAEGPRVPEETQTGALAP